MIGPSIEAATGAPSVPLQRGRWLAPTLLFLLTLAFYAINLAHPERFDELYHLLGARGYLAYGEPRIAGGVYERVELFTILVAWLFDWLGEGLAVGRLPGIVATAALGTALFIWLRHAAGSLAAWLAAVMFLVSPFVVDVAQDIRFYGPNGLFFFLGAIAVYSAFAEPAAAVAGRRRGLYLGAAAVAFVVALYLQQVVVIGLLGIGIWLALRDPGRQALLWLRARPVAAVVGGVLCLVVLAGLTQTALFPALVRKYHWTPEWGAENRNQFWFYHQWLALYYPTLWPLTPIAALIALARRPSPGLFCLVVFGTAFLVHAFAARKALLYIFYALPFLFALWGLALANVVAPVGRFLAATTRDALVRLGFAASPRAVTALTAGSLACVVLANAATIRTPLMLAGITVPPELPDARWDVVASALHDEIRAASIVIASNELHALYHFGRVDLLISASRLSEIKIADGAPEFSRDDRTGLPVVSKPGSIERIIACVPDGLIISENARWRRASQVADAVADEIVRRTEPVSLPPETGIRAYRWRHAVQSDDEGCAVVRAAQATATASAR